jgi:ABC-2 type transport system permease protein
MNSALVVARKDFEDAIRSRGLLLLAAVFIVFFVASSFFFADRVTDALQQQAAQQGQQASISSDTYLEALTQITRLLVPLVGIVVAYASIVGERESGTLKLLLALPYSRLDVVLGKFAGRSGVLALPVVLGFLLAAPVFPIAGVTFNAVNYAAFALLTVAIGVVFVALALGTSAIASTSRRAVIGVFGLYALFTLLWGQVARAAANELRTTADLETSAAIEAWLGVQHLNPIATYQSLVASVGPTTTLQARVGVLPGGGLQSRVYAQQLGEVPVYLSDPALVAYLGLWVVVPLALGYATFQRADL